MGIILGWVITYYFSHAGIDYRGIEFAGVTFRKLLYPELTLDQFIRYPIWILIFTMVVGLYPAFYAARMKPVDAMRRSF
jgi:ABC-type antimicrobial peptide transport system permease subunit